MGFIGIDRGIQDHWVYKDAEYLKVWLEMLLCARYAKEPGTLMVEGVLLKIEQSEFIFGRIKWSERLGISERRLRTLIEKMVADGMIQLVKRAPKFSVYCVTNYAKYRPQNDQQEYLEPEGIEDISDQQNVQQTSSKRPANVQQTTTKEQSKQSKQGNKVTRYKDGRADPSKTSYSEYVFLKPDEYDKLISQHGQDAVNEMIDILNSYKATKGTVYASDYHTMTGKGWVLQRFKEEQSRKLNVIQGGGNGGSRGRFNAGHEEANRRAADQDADLFFGTPG